MTQTRTHQPHQSIAITGNPNCGKTVIFNALTDTQQRIGNWSGVTVEKKSGSFTLKGQRFDIVDLPGTHSLSVTTDQSGLDEYIACQYLLSHRQDTVINVVDASNLERQLYLTSQLLEMQVFTIIALNMMDIAKRHGIALDIQKLSHALGCPVIPMAASSGLGLPELREALLKPRRLPKPVRYEFPPALDRTWHTLSERLSTQNQNSDTTPLPKRWIALRLLEEDVLVRNQMTQDEQNLAQSLRNTLQAELGEDIDLLIADARYRWVQTILKFTIRAPATHRGWTATIDRIMLNRCLGIPIFFLVMYTLFFFVINIGGAFQDFFNLGSGALFIHGTKHLLQALQFPAWSIALLTHGLGNGISTVASFIPIIGAMFLFLSLLEDSGYMARAAFVVDRLMASIGLPGKAFVPLIVGFGCNVPAVMATRTLATPRDRILTVMMTPFMSCGARLTVYTLFVAAFFPQHGALIIFALYALGIMTAILTALWLGATKLKGENTPMILELPRYHWPHWRTVLLTTWQRLKLFLKKASRFILPICVLLSLLNTLNFRGQLIENPGAGDSLLSQVGKIITPLFYPIGITQNNWPATVGLASGLIAKEVVVGTLDTLYSQIGQLERDRTPSTLKTALKSAVLSIPRNIANLGNSLVHPMTSIMGRSVTTPDVYGVMFQYFDGKCAAFAYLLFVLLYFPCISTLAVMQREIGRGWAYFSVLWSIGIAYCLSTLFYQAATFTQHPTQSMIYFSGIGLLILGIAQIFRYKNKPAVRFTTSSRSGAYHG